MSLIDVACCDVMKWVSSEAEYEGAAVVLHVGRAYAAVLCHMHMHAGAAAGHACRMAGQQPPAHTLI